jgi:predicted amidohydrolase YtcJ
VTRLLDVTEVDVRYESEVTRLRREAHAFSDVDTVALVNATILTMEHGDVHQDIIGGGTVILRDGLIDAVGKDGEVSVPAGALTIQINGGELQEYAGPKMKALTCQPSLGYIIPGFIDAHAHWEGTGVKYPATSWEMETFLAYGVTTMHKYVD